MKPYRTGPSVPRLPAVVFLVVVVVVTVCPAAKPKDKPAAQNGPTYRLNDPLTRAGYEHFYNLEYDKAVRNFEQVAQEHPDDPFAVNHLLSAVLFRELYRAGALDSELYAKDSFLDKKKYPIDAKAQQQIKQLTERALQLSEARLKANPNDVDALYTRGVTRATRALYIALIDKAWFAGLRNAVGARRDHERVLELDPNYVDAKLVVGVHNYVMGSLPWTVKVAAAVVGLSGNKQKGIQYLYDAINARQETSVDARVALALFLRREERYPEALKVVGELVSGYPRNFLYGLEQALLMNAAGHAPDAIAAYRKLLAEGKEGKYPGAHLEQAAFGLGITLRGQKQFDTAAEAFDMVKEYPRVEPEMQQKADLAAGEMYDLMMKRDAALKKYQAVIAAGSDSPPAELARKRLKQPYRTQ